MPRSEARLRCSIWNDRDFLELPQDAQRLYVLLMSQSDLSLCGVLPYLPQRWAQMCSDGSIESTVKAVAVLEEKRFIVVDETTCELLVRSLMRWDNVVPTSNVWWAAMEAAAVVLSESIRAALGMEIDRIKAIYSHDENSNEAPLEAPSVVSPIGANGVAPGGTRARGGTRPPGPHPPIPIPLSPSPYNFDEFWRTYPRRTGKGAAQKAWNTAINRSSPDLIIAGAGRFRDDPNREDQYTPHPATWLNQDRWEDDPLPSRTGSRSKQPAWRQTRAEMARRDDDARLGS